LGVKALDKVPHGEDFVRGGPRDLFGIEEMIAMNAPIPEILVDEIPYCQDGTVAVRTGSGTKCGMVHELVGEEDRNTSPTIAGPERG
jgi:hypothetical protein